jgi:HK97 family phage major capsid protein
MNRRALAFAAVALAVCIGIAEPAFAQPLALFHHAVAPLTHGSFSDSIVSMAILIGGLPLRMTENERRLGRYMRDAGGHGTGGGGRELNAEEIVAELKKSIDKSRSELVEIAEKAVDEAKKGIGMSEGAKEKADEALIKFNELTERLNEIEQKGLRRDEQRSALTPGQQFVENDAVKAFMANPRGGSRVDMDVKAIISSATTLVDGSAGDLLVPYRVPGIVTPAQRRMTVRDLLMPGRTNQPSIQYAKETGYTNAAATVSEQTGPTKPQSDIQFDIVTTAVATIAHFVIATKQILDDAPMLQSYIDFRLRYGLAYVEEQQLLNGSGTGTNLNGIYTQATAFAAGSTVIGASSQKLDVLRVAMLQVALSELEASGQVLNPRDWAEIELLKDSTGRYIIGDPKADGVKRLWGKPVVDTTAMTAGNFLVGAFESGAQIFDREDANVAISTEDANNFRQNLVTILAEERVGLAVYRPEAFIKGTFSTAITDLTS